MNTYNIGTAVTVSVQLVDTAGHPADPGALHCTIRRPGSEPIHYLYGTDSQVIRTGVGAYEMDVDTDVSGEWLYRWAATGARATTADGIFNVSASELFPP